MGIMYVEEVNLYQFRNYSQINLSLHPKLNIFYGKNAQGKTNILESLYLCATGRSHRTTHEKEAIHWQKDEAHIRLFLHKQNRIEKIDFHLDKGGKKSAAHNGIPIQKLGELLGIMNVVIFSPEDLQLIKSGPKERRRFLDIELCQLDRIYYYNLQQYHKVLKQRNHFLKQINKNPKDMTDIWDEQLVYFGEKVIETRKVFIEKLNDLAFLIHGNITAQKEKLSIEYAPSVSSNYFREKLKEHFMRDIQSGTTSIGPHRDDIIFKVNGMDLRTYGSQGQQRSAALSLKIAEIDLMQQETGEYPVLLLDDVLSELDANRQTHLLLAIQDKVQTFITAPSLTDVARQLIHTPKVFHVKHGEITLETEN